MKENLAGALCAAAFFGLSGTAAAAPIYFDFTGNLTSSPDGAPTGQAISGGFTLETDRLLEAPPRPGQRQWLDLNPTGPAGPLAHLDLGDRSVSFPRFPGATDALVSFNDGCTPTGCAPFGSDNFSIFVSSADQSYPPDFTGTVQFSWMYFSSLAVNRPPGAPLEFFDYFDLAEVSVNSILTLPLHELVGLYSEDTLECAASICRVTEQRQYGFSIESVARGEGVRSVPEPGTLGLLGAGLLAALVMRRRRPRPQGAQANRTGNQAVLLRRLSGLAAAWLSATAAHAIPITFEFSGTDIYGVRGSGQFLIETAGMRILDTGPGDPWMQRSFTDLLGLNDRPNPTRGSLNIGGENFVLGEYPVGGYGGIVFVDLCRSECLPEVRDNWSVQLYEQDFPFGSPPGAVTFSRSLSFSSGRPTSADNPDLFDWTTVRPEDILTLPLLQPYISYYETVRDCSSGECLSTQLNYHQFDVDTVVRTAGQPLSVPEPGTLGLLGAGLLAALLLRRRVPRPQHA